MKRMILAWCLWWGIFHTAFASSSKISDNNKIKTIEAEAIALEQSINIVVQENLKCENKDDCYALAIGAKGCGGPIRYAVVSKKNTYEKILKPLSTLLIDKTNKLNEIKPSISNCSFVMPPEVTCNHRACSTNVH